MSKDILKGVPELEIRETENGYELILDGKKLDNVLDFKIIKPRGKPPELNVTLAVKIITETSKGKTSISETKANILWCDTCKQKVISGKLGDPCPYCDFGELESMKKGNI